MGWWLILVTGLIVPWVLTFAMGWVVLRLIDGPDPRLGEAEAKFWGLFIAPAWIIWWKVTHVFGWWNF